MDRRDPLGYYNVLNVSPDALPEEIELAYQFLKKSYRERHQHVDIAKIRAAYDTLHRPATRKSYDDRKNQTLARRATRLGQPGVLAMLLILFGVVIGVVFGPSLKAGLTQYQPGDALLLREDGSAFGTVLRFEREHAFFNGTTAAAYMIETPGTGGAIWYPARDLTRICSR